MSNGFLGVVVALHMCARVDMYGFSQVRAPRRGRGPEPLVVLPLPQPLPRDLPRRLVDRRSTRGDGGWG